MATFTKFAKSPNCQIFPLYGRTRGRGTILRVWFPGYGGPERPCQLPISTFSISNLEISRYRFPICRFIITNFTFSCYQFPICIFLVTKLKISHYQIVTKSSCYCRCPMYNYIHAHPKLLEGGFNTPVRACAVSAAS